MGDLLDKIESPKDLKGLSLEELTLLSTELREFIVDAVSKTGGHLASSLGAVDIAVALHFVYDTPKDKLIWDVGHQAYAHKILTGRRADFKTLRQAGGISGFPKITESPYDSFGTGHSSTSISAGLGMAAASELNKSGNKVVAIIGDGSMTAGLAFEGLNQAGHIKKNLVVILNDNEMSIAKNVGALSSYLSRKITGRTATKLKKELEKLIGSIPKLGKGLVSIAKKAEDSLITLFTPGMLFEGLGFHYVGPIDGHNMFELLKALKTTKDLNCPVLIHVLTKKGKGYRPAEREPSKFHGIGPFDPETGENIVKVKAKDKGGLTYTKVFSSALVEIGRTNEKVVAITAAMPEGTGLSAFAGEFPERFFDVGIAEQHAITFAAGLAKEGFIPVTAIYSTFMQRAYDSVLHDICLQELPIVMALDRAGIVGADGPTHHGLFDISFLRHIPNMVLASPKDGAELRQLLYSATLYNKAVALRYPRGACSGDIPTEAFKEIPLGSAERLIEGTDLTILALGTMVAPAVEAAAILKKKGISAGVVNARFVKPLDEQMIINSLKKSGKLLTVEENALQGGFGSAVLELLEEQGLDAEVRRLGVPDKFVEQGTQAELRAELGLDCDGIVRAAEGFLVKQGTLDKTARL